jgi:hypothetical protein
LEERSTLWSGKSGRELISFAHQRLGDFARNDSAARGRFQHDTWQKTTTLAVQSAANGSKISGTI